MENNTQAKVFFVLVNYNGEVDTIECINSINSMLTYENYQIIVVDNSTNITSLEKLKSANLKKTILIRSDNNGFAAGCNRGIMEAEKLGYEYIILLNNDTLIKSPRLIEELMSCFTLYQSVGISGGKIFYNNSPNDCWYAAGYLSAIRLRAKNRINIEGMCETPFVTGCLQMISKEAIDRVGLMEEDYFFCYEDADYCERMHRAGYKTMYNSKAQIYHKVSRSAPATSPCSIYSSNRARYIYIKRFLDKAILVKCMFRFELFIKIIFYKGDKKKAIFKVEKWIRDCK